MQNEDKKQAWLEHIRSDEEWANIRKMNEWLQPQLKILMKTSLEEITLLSVGCGFGTDVDTLVNAGINAYGVEPFARHKAWDSRENKERFIVADGRNLPFRSESFHVVYCSEVIEHVGQETKKVQSVVRERREFAEELTRILKRGGIIVMSTPNRHFCADIGHGSNFFGIRVHSPFNDFTLSFKDIRSIFLHKCGCNGISTMPYENFVTWDLYTKTGNYPLIRLLWSVVKIYLRFLDRSRFLRSSFLSPHLILAIKK